MNRMTKRSALTLSLLVPSLALADVQSGLTSATSWAAIVVASLGALALMYAGVKKMWGHPDATEKLQGVVVGGIIAIGASGIFGLLKSWFSF